MGENEGLAARMSDVPAWMWGVVVAGLLLVGAKFFSSPQRNQLWPVLRVVAPLCKTAPQTQQVSADGQYIATLATTTCAGVFEETRVFLRPASPAGVTGDFGDAIFEQGGRAELGLHWDKTTLTIANCTSEDVHRHRERWLAVRVVQIQYQCWDPISIWR